MDIIQDVIQNNNTAQEQLKGILENYNKTAQKLEIREPLHGGLDFSILAEYGFSTIKVISLAKGEITSIAGLPGQLFSLNCAENLLTKIDNLPSGLQSLNIAHNFLTTIDVSQLQQLELLDVTDNKITSLENLPPTLTSIKCDNNQLQQLDLVGILNLEQLRISNNPITVIDHLPEGIVDFQMENTPTIEFRNSPIIPINNTANKVDEYTSAADYNESLNEYFRLKNNYEEKLFKMKKKIHEKSSSNRAAQKQVLALKPQCIKCKRPVGTLFSKKDNRYIAICGDAKNPCKLDIQIFTGTILPLTQILYIIKKDIDVLKDAIIKQKLDTLFSYVSEEESVKMFKRNIKAYNDESQTFKEILNKHTETYHSSQKQEQLDKKKGDIFKLIEHIRDLLDEYAKTNTREILKTAMEMQIKELIPETHNLRTLKNEVMEMHHNVINNDVMEHSLFQYPVILSKMDDVFGEPPRVIKFLK